MPDYREMYLIMVRAAEKAIQALIEAQQQCEELYLSDDLPCVDLYKKDDSNSIQELFPEEKPQ